MAEGAPEVMFYHLETDTLDRVLPQLLEKTMERGWRAVVQCASDERLEALDLALWTYRDDSFLAHGTRRTGVPELQPIYLTTGSDAPNGAQVRFVVDGAAAEDFSGYERVVYLFDGNDPQALGTARQQWMAARNAGCAVSYWQRSPAGRWERKA